VASIKQAVA